MQCYAVNSQLGGGLGEIPIGFCNNSVDQLLLVLTENTPYLSSPMSQIVEICRDPYAV